MAKPAKCECRTCRAVNPGTSGHGAPIYIRCDWCKTRDELWPELVGSLAELRDRIRQEARFAGDPIDEEGARLLRENAASIIEIIGDLLSRTKEVTCVPNAFS